MQLHMGRTGTALITLIPSGSVVINPQFSSSHSRLQVSPAPDGLTAQLTPTSMGTQTLSWNAQGENGPIHKEEEVEIVGPLADDATMTITENQ